MSRADFPSAILTPLGIDLLARMAPYGIISTRVRGGWCLWCPVVRR